MKPRTEYRLRYALRLVASVFLLSSPCACQRVVEPGAGYTSRDAATSAGLDGVAVPDITTLARFRG